MAETAIKFHPCGSVEIDLPRYGEYLVISPIHEGGFSLDGVNVDRGFSWYVGTFLEFAPAILCAKAIRSEEMAGRPV